MRHVWLNSTLRALGGILVVAALGACLHLDEQSGFVKSFSHTDYGYSIAIPRELSCKPFPSRYPLHGCRIEDAKSSWSVTLEAHYYSPDAQNPLDDEWESFQKQSETEGWRAVAPAAHETLRGLEALRFELERRGQAAEPQIQAGLIAARPSEGIVYSIVMTGNSKYRARFSAVYSAVKDSFRLLPIR